MRESTKVIKEMGLKMGAEVGVNVGTNAKNMLDSIPDLHLILIDNCSTMYLIARDNLKAYENRIVQMLRSSSDVGDIQDESLDFAYIDACHTYEAVKVDLEVWLPKIRKGGLLCGHDYNLRGEHYDNVYQAVNEFAEKHNFKVNFKRNEDDETNEDWWICL